MTTSQGLKYAQHLVFLGVISLLTGCGSEPYQPDDPDASVAFHSAAGNIYTPGTVLVISNAEFPLAARDVANVLGSNAKAYDLSLFGARQQVMHNKKRLGFR